MWRRFRRHRLAVGSGIFLLLLVIAALAAPLVAPVDPLETNITQLLKPPTSTHWLGTDSAGRDVWSRTIYATRISLSVGLVAVSLSMMIALVLGSLSGYYGGKIDMLIMRLTDLIMCIPNLIFIVVVVTAVGSSFFNVMVVIGLLGWPSMVRLLRGQILSVREREFVIAAQCVGVPARQIMISHILPNSFGPLLVAATFRVAGAILTEAGLSFLGFGVLPPTPSWGNMLNQARSYRILGSSPWAWIPPGVMILVTVMAINFVGDGIRDAIDPRHRDV